MTERVAAVVVSYNRCDSVRRSLEALLAQTRRLDEIIVVDNASSDGTVELLADEFPEVRLVRMPGNSGAAGGFAVGLQKAVAAGHDWAWVFNDDDEPRHDALEHMLKSAADLPGSTGLLGCGRTDASGRPRHLGAYWRHRHIPVPVPESDGAALAVDVVTLSGTLVSAGVVRKFGVPHAEYFMMIEDLEYCLRVRRSGWGVFVLPRRLVTSRNMGSEGKSPPWRGYYQTRNQLAMSLEHRSLRELWWWLIRNLKLCAGAFVSGDRPVSRVRLRILGAWHGLRGVTGQTIDPAA